MMTHTLRAWVLCLLGMGLWSGCQDRPGQTAETNVYKTWNHYLGDPGRTHFSTLSGFSPENVTQLEPAWSYESPDWGQMQMNPLVVDTLLFGVTAAQRAFALDARTGAPVWIFGDTVNAWFATCRGLAYWEQGADKRILYSRGSDLWALNALTGEPVTTFGTGGKIDMRSGLPARAADKFLVSSTPGTIHKNLIIMPTRVSEGPGAAPGDIMAFDVRSGALVWRFHTLPHPGEFGYDTWEDLESQRKGVVGGANNWAGMTLDAAREILYVPTGSAAPDFYGGVRKGQNLFANCLLALDANTGERLWHFQFTHHDIWDRDPPAPPNLLTVERNGARIPAVAQITKQGYVYLFNRLTGEPLFDIEEVPVPPSKLAGESAWPTQPIPVKPKPFARQAQDLSADDISPYAPNPEALRDQLMAADRRRYAPPDTTAVLLLPGYDGGAEWGGAGADPDNGILYVNANEMAWLLQMEQPEDVSDLSAGEQVYQRNCAVCHQSDLSGMPASGYPSLVDIGLRKKASEIRELIAKGKGMMPGFPHIDEAQKDALTDFLMERGEDKQEVVSSGGSGVPELPYRHTGYHKFLDANGLPGISPPWGTLHAIDMNSGEYLWQIPLGVTESLKAEGHPPTGTENYGGPVITENGLLFIAATKDGYFRAFDRSSGKMLWEYKLPAAAFATPALYEAGGKQYIAIACGGEKLGTPKGHTIMAFALPEAEENN